MGWLLSLMFLLIWLVSGCKEWYAITSAIFGVAGSISFLSDALKSDKKQVLKIREIYKSFYERKSNF